VPNDDEVSGIVFGGRSKGAGEDGAGILATWKSWDECPPQINAPIEHGYNDGKHGKCGEIPTDVKWG
jgi:hypothetical protein